MLKVYNCIIYDHNLTLVILAGLLCAIASLTAVNLLHHLHKAGGRMRLVWSLAGGVSFGFGIWATHFVAMLAFLQNVESAYNVPLTVASLFVAIIFSSAGFATTCARKTNEGYLYGGAIVGAGIGAMHFTGMSAYEIRGYIAWDPALVIASLLAGIVLGAVAIRTALQHDKALTNILAMVLLTLAICTMHFTAMGAVNIVPDPSIVISPTAVSSTWLAGAVALAALAILALTGLALWLDVREIRRRMLEEDRMNSLANAAVEGLIICDDTTVITANDSFCTLIGQPLDNLTGSDFTKLFTTIAPSGSTLNNGEPIWETHIIKSDGSRKPVEIISRVIDYRSRPHTAIAVRDIAERKKAEEDIRRLALHDTLTGLPNRRSFTAQLQTAMESLPEGKLLALLCLDLDRFKEVNDLFGHAAGDAMLQKVAELASDALSEGQVLARLGGDEFAIIAPGLDHPDQAAKLAEAILEGFRRENERATSDGLMSSSIGIAICPKDTDDQNTLINHADTALYRAKSEGRDTYRFYEHEMGQAARSRRIMEHELRHAVTRNELRLVYQPQKKLDTGEVIGYEALLRWKHPERGDISPAEFVPVAEESGVIVPIGEWVLRKACETAADWSSELIVAVNVSAVQLHSVSFPQTVHQVLLETGLPAQRLELEITETALVRDMHRALATLRQLKTLGIRVAMDDFGTGYSSLSNLRAFPFDKIKIDGSFIRQVDTNEQAATIVKAVLGIGRGLGLPVLAEGVETSGELAFLAGELCQIGQGYYLGRPASLESPQANDCEPSEESEIDEKGRQNANITAA